MPEPSISFRYEDVVRPIKGNADKPDLGKLDSRLQEEALKYLDEQASKRLEAMPNEKEPRIVMLDGRVKSISYQDGSFRSFRYDSKGDLVRMSLDGTILERSGRLKDCWFVTSGQTSFKVVPGKFESARDKYDPVRGIVPTFEGKFQISKDGVFSYEKDDGSGVKTLVHPSGKVEAVCPSVSSQTAKAWEIYESVANSFHVIDKDGNGRLSRSELERAAAENQINGRLASFLRTNFDLLRDLGEKPGHNEGGSKKHPRPYGIALDDLKQFQNLSVPTYREWYHNHVVSKSKGEVMAGRGVQGFLFGTMVGQGLALMGASLLMRNPAAGTRGLILMGTGLALTIGGAGIGAGVGAWETERSYKNKIKAVDHMLKSVETQ